MHLAQKWNGNKIVVMPMPTGVVHIDPLCISAYTFHFHFLPHWIAKSKICAGGQIRYLYVDKKYWK